MSQCKQGLQFGVGFFIILVYSITLWTVSLLASTKYVVILVKTSMSMTVLKPLTPITGAIPLYYCLTSMFFFLIIILKCNVQQAQ